MYYNRHLLKFGFLLGKSIDDIKVKEHLERLGYTYRLVSVDGNHYMVTADLQSNRLDIELKNNKIIKF